MMGIDGDRDQHGVSSWDNHDDDQTLETEQLALARDERLPWLESSDDDDAEYDGIGSARLIAVMALGLILLAAIVGGIWWATHRVVEVDPLADGSTITAPKTPYKEAPRDPGGKTFDGTGDSSFAVSEGQNLPPRLEDRSGAAPVALAPAPAPVPSGKPAVGVPAVASKAGAVGVQVGAFSSQASAEAAWAKLVAQSSGALSSVSHRVVEANADIGKVYRLQAIAGDVAGANVLCAKLKTTGIACQVK